METTQLLHILSKWSSFLHPGVVYSCPLHSAIESQKLICIEISKIRHAWVLTCISTNAHTHRNTYTNRLAGATQPQCALPEGEKQSPGLSSINKWIGKKVITSFSSGGCTKGRILEIGRNWLNLSSYFLSNWSNEVSITFPPTQAENSLFCRAPNLAFKLINNKKVFLFFISNGSVSETATSVRGCPVLLLIGYSETLMLLVSDLTKNTRNSNYTAHLNTT